MRIGIDARPIGGRFTGDRTYWRGLISGLASIDRTNEYVLFLRNELAEENQIELPDNFSVRVLRALSDRVWSIVDFKHGLKVEGIDVAHVQYTLPPFLPCPAVTTIHDISFRLFPQHFSNRDRTLLNMSVPDSIRRANHVLTVSESSRRDILAAYNFLSPEKITATYLAANSVYRPAPELETMERRKLHEKYGIDGPYVLSVGVLQPRKNLPMLIRAFSEARWNSGLEHRLIIVGKIGWLSEETENAVAYAGDAVKLVGYVPDEDLPPLYRCADIMAYPSIYEGFGLPALEAMSCGCPVIASSSSSLPEVVGNAGILLSPEDQAAWTTALATLTTDGNRRMKIRQAGLVQATRFSWNDTARYTAEVYFAAATK